jgi:uncharacterized membrane protein YkvA (DUF1232 family)
MSTDQIRAQIQDTWNDELEHGAFARIVRDQLAKQADAAASSAEEREQRTRTILEGWRVQLEQVPELIDAVAEAAAAARVGEAVAPILAAAEEYFLDADDVLPDSLGILGLMDDMYLALSLLNSVSEQYRHLTGHPLIDADLAPCIQPVRALFKGKRLATLDASIQAALCRPAMISSIQALSSLSRPLAVKNWDPKLLRAGERDDAAAGEVGVL